MLGVLVDDIQFLDFLLLLAGEDQLSASGQDDQDQLYSLVDFYYEELVGPLPEFPATACDLCD